MKNINASGTVSEARKSSKPVRSFKSVINWNPPSTRLKRVTLSRTVSGNTAKFAAAPAPSLKRFTPQEPSSFPYAFDLPSRKTASIDPFASQVDASAEPQVTRRIWEELKKDFGNDSPQPIQYDASMSASSVSSFGVVTEKFEGVPHSPRQEAASQATTAVALIQQIETFVRSNRPGLAIQLDGRLAARIEIEKLGPREVTLRLVGKNGPPSAENVGRIREELRGRGIRIGAITVA